jgi:hypothetical protein
MTLQAPGDLLEQRDPAAHGAGAPAVEKYHRPFRARVFSEPLPVLSEEISPDAVAFVPQDLLEPDFSVRAWLG